MKGLKYLTAAIAVSVACAVCAALSGCVVNGFIIGETYDNAQSYAAGNFTYNAAEVESVSVGWYSGEVRLIQSDGEQISIYESGENLKECEKLHSRLYGGALDIRFWQSGYSGTVSSKDKHLTVELPRGVSLTVASMSAKINAGSLEVSDCTIVAVSGSIEIGSLKCESADFATTSGSMTLEKVTAIDTLDAGTVSGKIVAKGVSAPSAEFGSTSGAIEICLESCSLLDIGTTSGSVEIVLPASLGATVSYSSTSGSISIAQDYSAQGGKYVIGDGGCEISVGTTSGSLKIKKI